MERFVIVDPSLKDKRGHHFNLASRISQSANSNDQKPVWFCHRDGAFTQTNGADVVPLFGVSMYDAYKNANTSSSPIQALNNAASKASGLLFGKSRRPQTNGQASKGYEDIAANLLQGVREFGLGPDDRILFHTADGMSYAALAHIFNEISPEDFPIVHACTPYDPVGVMPNRVEDMPIDQCVRDWQERGLIDKRLFLYGECALLAAHLSEQWKVTVRPLELPVVEQSPAHQDQDHASSADQDAHENQQLTIVVLGPARTEKGFHLLPDIVRRTLEFTQSDGAAPVKISFIIQCSAQIVGYSEPILKAIDRLRQYPDNVTLLEDTLDDDLYLKTLNAADVMLLPYNAKQYGKRSSGIVAESLSMGKIIAATSGSYPASVIGTGTGIDAVTPLEFGQKLADVARNAAAYRKAAQDQGAQYRANNRVEDYVSKCLAAER